MPFDQTTFAAPADITLLGNSFPVQTAEALHSHIAMEDSPEQLYGSETVT